MSRRSANQGLHRFSGPGGLAEARGFTLLEILVVLALFGLISALFIGSSGTLLQAASREDAGNTALGAIASARHEAVLAGRVVELHLDAKTRVIEWGAGRAALAGSDGVSLLSAVKTSSVLIGGQLEETPIAGVRFYPDGTCDPFRLEIRREKTREVLAIDPWTCTVLAPGKTGRTP